MVSNLKYLRIKKLLVFSVFLTSLTGALNAQYHFTQLPQLTPHIDTLLINHRSGGSKIDSLDRAYYNYFPSVFGVGRAVLPSFRYGSQATAHRYFFSDDRTIYRANFHFTALPYTGFFYSFGGGGEQVMDLRYTQNVGQNLNISFRYHRTTSDQGLNSFLMRHLETKTNDLSLNMHFRKNRIQSFLSLYY
jgi:hypothetical protein